MPSTSDSRLESVAKDGVGGADSVEGQGLRQTEFLSKGLEELLSHGAEPEFDVVVVGSGYGASVAAAELAGTFDPTTGKPTRVCVLERGREYLPGSFPSRMAELPGHVRFSNGKTLPRGQRTGLFDVRLGEDMNALVANGVGGGSLINAGVMEEPDLTLFARLPWPQAIRDDNPGIKDFLEKAGKRLGSKKRVAGSKDQWRDNRWTDPSLLKFDAMQRLSGGSGFVAPRLTVALDRGASAANVTLNKCVRCGDCMTGCNYGAKESLDVTLLVEANSRGAEIFSGATVLSLRKARPGGTAALWEVLVVHTDEKLRRRQAEPPQGDKKLRRGEPIIVRTRRVVLAAGTLGSTEILLRSRSAGLNLSPRLGTSFSANGDMIAAAVDLKQEANAISDENLRPDKREVGPTITAMIDRRKDGGTVVQDLSVPGALRRLAQETIAVADSFAALAEPDDSLHAPSDRDPCAIDEGRTANVLMLAVMGADRSDGHIELVGDPSRRASGREGDGAIKIVWPQARDDKRLDERESMLGELLKAGHLGGRILSNPLWRVLPRKMEFLFGDERGPLLTVHPLGGCPMGDDVFGGVVDDKGRVFVGPPNPKHEDDAPLDPPAIGTVVYPGLVVLDGSIVPSSLGINPALTITALALRAIEQLIKTDGDWKLAPRDVPTPARQERRVFRRLDPHDAPPPRQETEIQVLERLSGRITVDGKERIAELTLRFKEQAVERLMSPASRARLLTVDPWDGNGNSSSIDSKLRLFTPRAWARCQRDPIREPADTEACAVFPIAAGALRIFHRERSDPCSRRIRTLVPWFQNRGWRDAAQTLVDRLTGEESRTSPQDPWSVLLRNRWTSTYNLLSRAGEVRLLEYVLDLGAPTRCADGTQLPGWNGARLRGFKRLTYTRRGNPWRQLMNVSFEQAPFRGIGVTDPVLELDLHFLTRCEVPLLRITRQADQPTALIDLICFALYLMRVLLRVHTWSFRKPDPPPAREICRLPGYVPGLGKPEIFEIPVDRLPGVAGTPVFIRLTHYAGNRKGARPVLMIHGYSASGTTFAHHSTPSLARYLRDRGCDPWLVDLRTSSGMPTARHPWSFEEVAYSDIPLAVDHVFRACGGNPIDVVAHCMGSAMLSMALLGDEPDKRPTDELDPDDPYWSLRKELPKRIRRLVISQVAPLTMFSRANVFRAFVMRYLLQYLDADHYAFRVEGKPTFGDQLFDRLLATMPYPEEEFDYENPPFLRALRRPWVGTRHRMDALYGRDFSIKNMSPTMLRYIDDHFGPMSVETVSQTIHFARFGQLADRNGNTRFATPQRMLERLKFPIFSIHGKDNGLADRSTKFYMDRNNRLLGRKLDYRAKAYTGLGHQDSLIGTSAEREVYPDIVAFLEEKREPR